MNQLGLGTAALGRPHYINLRQEQAVNQDLDAFKAQGFKVLEQAYQLGVRYFDTAPGYGMAEKLLLDWLLTKDDNTIQIATKWGYTYIANFDAMAKIHEVKEHSLAKLNEQWAVSSAFLPKLKVYQIHSATLETGVFENNTILNQLALLKKEHQLEIGITTTGANQTEVIRRALDVSVNGHALFDSFQVTYNMLDQSFESVSDQLIKSDKRIIIKEALANGRIFKNEYYKAYHKLYNKLEQLATKHEVGTDVIALKFCQQTIQDCIVLSGASSLSHLESNLRANSIKLSDEEIDSLKDFAINPSLYWEERKQLKWN